MKLGKRLISLALALVMVFSLTVGASAATTQNIKVQLSPNITVKYNGEAQNMTDVNGNPVYPLLNNGTTYLPVRAVSNMLCVDVDWDGATQTVILTDPAGGRKPVSNTDSTGAKPAPSTITVQLSPNITVKYNGEAQSMTDVNGNPVYPLLNDGTTYLPIRAVSNMLGVGVDWDGETQTVLLFSATTGDNTAQLPDFIQHAQDTPKRITFIDPTSNGIRMSMKWYKCTDNEIEAAVAEFEATGPNGKNKDGQPTFTYALFKTSENAKALGDKHVACDYVEVDWSTADDSYVRVKLTKQVAEVIGCVILWKDADADDAGITFPLKFNQWNNIPLLNGSGEYLLTISPVGSNAVADFDVVVTANIENSGAWTLLSNSMVDFENAPKTVAKAAELTKNCKTDAEKITAIFEFVAKTIKYDYNNYIKRQANLDTILDKKTGVCEHYAVLMAGMLRSQGIPCKVVGGKAYQNGTGWGDHAWVSVSPDTKGLDMSRLGAGHDEDGWIRLDPTWGGTSYGRSQAAIDKNHQSEYAY